jgi:hypothetical protein
VRSSVCSISSHSKFMDDELCQQFVISKEIVQGQLVAC